MSFIDYLLSLLKEPSVPELGLDWSKVKYFKQSEFVKPESVDADLVYKLDALRGHLGKPIIITESYNTKGHAKQSQHYIDESGRYYACDIKCPSIHPVDLYLIAERFDFRGLGVYKWGIHVDTRKGNAARWLQLENNGPYLPLTFENLKRF